MSIEEIAIDDLLTTIANNIFYSGKKHEKGMVCFIDNVEYSLDKYLAKTKEKYDYLPLWITMNQITVHL